MPVRVVGVHRQSVPKDMLEDAVHTAMSEELRGVKPQSKLDHHCVQRLGPTQGPWL